MAVSQIQSRQPRIRLFGAIVIAILLLFTFRSLFLNQRRPGPAVPLAVNETESEVSLVDSYDGKDSANFDIVVAHYGEDPHFVRGWTDRLRETGYIKQMGSRVIIYTKNQTINLLDLKKGSGAEEVYRLPNIGREGATYLHHIIKTYDNPNKFTWFSQGTPNGVSDKSMDFWLKKLLWKDLRPNTGYLTVNGGSGTCGCLWCGGDQHPLHVPIYNVFDGHGTCDGEHYVSFLGQLLVSGKRIQSQPLKSYQWLNSLISAPADHWIHAETEPHAVIEMYMPKGSSPDSPLFGHTLERSWTTIFNCAYPERIVPQGLGTIDYGLIHCWDFAVDHEGPGPQPEHFPGFEEIDAGWDKEIQKQMIEEEKARQAEARQKEQEKMRELQKQEEAKERMAKLAKEKAHDLNALPHGETLSSGSKGVGTDASVTDSSVTEVNKP